MGEKLKLAAGYVLAGILSCAVLVGVAECMDSGSPMPVTADSPDSTVQTDDDVAVEGGRWNHES